jgi:hypothetical protein
MESFNIGDYIEYKYYSKYYSNTIKQGYIISGHKNRDFFDVINQSGGQIWCCITPIRKITEEEFLSRFCIFEENESALLQKLDDLPVNLQNIIKNAIEKKKLAVINAMELYCTTNKNKYPPTSQIKIDDEVWAIQWYILNVLRNYEPYKIKETLNFCYGASDLVQKFMTDNINFMVDMQFHSSYLSDIMIVLIQEQWLKFLYSQQIISSHEYSSRHFQIVIKKLEELLVLKQPVIDDIKLEIYINKDKSNYKMDTSLLNLINTKFVFVNRSNKYFSNKSSDCYKRVNVNLALGKTSQDCYKIMKLEKIPSKLCRTERLSFIKKIDDCSSFYLNSQKNILIQKNEYGGSGITIKHFNLYCVKTEKLLGSFEFNTDEVDLSYIYLEDICHTLCNNN